MIWSDTIEDLYLILGSIVNQPNLLYVNNNIAKVVVVEVIEGAYNETTWLFSYSQEVRNTDMT
jgi:hypothetical protein